MGQVVSERSEAAELSLGDLRFFSDDKTWNPRTFAEFLYWPVPFLRWGTALRYAPYQLEQSAMSEQAKSDPKVQKPAAHYDEPHEVVLDASLSKVQKVEALGALEQDARQLAQASSEGMSGGERTKLHEVLVAKDALGLPVLEAYETVLQDLRSRQKRDPANQTRDLLRQAITALEALLDELP